MSELTNLPAGMTQAVWDTLPEEARAAFEAMAAELQATQATLAKAPKGKTLTPEQQKELEAKQARRVEFVKFDLAKSGTLVRAIQDRGGETAGEQAVYALTKAVKRMPYQGVAETLAAFATKIAEWEGITVEAVLADLYHRQVRVKKADKAGAEAPASEDPATGAEVA